MQKIISLLMTCIIFLSISTLAFAEVKTSVSDFSTTNKRDETERFNQIYSFDPNGKIEVTNVNGSITVEAWDNPQIKLEYDKIAENRERLADVKINIEADQNNFRVKTDYVKDKENWNKKGNLYVNFRLMVPRGAILEGITSVNGDVKISELTDSVKASTVNGNVLGVNLSGELKLTTVNGNVDAELTRLKDGGNVKLTTVNGEVNLYLPSSIDAVFSGSTVNGSIKSDFGLTVKKSKYGSSSTLGGTLGGGNSNIKLSSVNGAINIKQASAPRL